MLGQPSRGRPSSKRVTFLKAATTTANAIALGPAAPLLPRAAAGGFKVGTGWPRPC